MNILEIENLSKQYRLGTVGTGTLGHDLNRWWSRMRGKEDPYLKIGESNDRSVKGNSDYVWALKDINLNVKEGEVLGIIGKNGAGKSTLLKILSKVTGPTTGSIKAYGRIASLLEVGTGFHPELTGRENIYLNGAILGMRKHEITRKFDEIVDFAGVERYIDTPVKRYSSGMYVRLAFAVAAHLEPEILIVDEVLAVGDIEFQKKALGKMKDVSQGEGRTVLFVSHNMGAVRTICSRAMLLSNGMISETGDVNGIIESYFSGSSQFKNTGMIDNNNRSGNGSVIINKIKFLDKNKIEKDTFFSGEKIDVVFYYEKIKIDSEINDIHFGVQLFNNQDQFVTVLNNKMANCSIKHIETQGIIICTIDKNPLMYGEFYFNYNLFINGILSDKVEKATKLIVQTGDYYNSGFPNSGERTGVYVNQNWTIK